MRRYEVKGPCPELGMVLARLALEVPAGETAVLVSKWRYVVEDVRNSAQLLGVEVLSVSEGPDGVEVVVRRAKT
ncbi:MAG: sulfurtransferase TusA family protein [Thermoproteus sp.]